jgi:hypothetical protein
MDRRLYTRKLRVPAGMAVLVAGLWRLANGCVE